MKEERTRAQREDRVSEDTHRIGFLCPESSVDLNRDQVFLKCTTMITEKFKKSIQIWEKFRSQLYKHSLPEIRSCIMILHKDVEKRESSYTDGL